MNKELNLNISEEKILKHFKECKSIDTINLKTKTGYIYMVGGILNKLEGTNHYIAIKNKWVLV